MANPFRVKHSKWLETEAARVAEIILVPKFWNRAWSPESLKAALKELGLDYSMTDIEEIIGELHAQGIVEDVTE